MTEEEKVNELVSLIDDLLHKAIAVPTCQDTAPYLVPNKGFLAYASGIVSALDVLGSAPDETIKGLRQRIAETENTKINTLKA